MNNFELLSHCASNKMQSRQVDLPEFAAHAENGESRRACGKV